MLVPGRLEAAEWQYTCLGGITFLGSTTLVDSDLASSNLHVSFGGAATFLTNGIVGVEGIAQLTPRFLKNGGSALVASGRTEAFMGNVVFTAPRRLTEYTLRPFVSGGVGLLRASLEGVPVQGIGPLVAYGTNLAGLDVGGGAIGFLTNHLGLRFDLRYFSTLNRTDQGANAVGKTHLSYMTATVGFVYRR